MPNSEFAGVGGGPTPSGKDTNARGASPVTVVGTGPGGEGGPMAMAKDTHVGGPSPVTGTGKGSPGDGGGTENLAMDTNANGLPPDTSR